MVTDFEFHTKLILNFHSRTPAHCVIPLHLSWRQNFVHRVTIPWPGQSCQGFLTTYAVVFWHANYERRDQRTECNSDGELELKFRIGFEHSSEVSPLAVSLAPRVDWKGASHHSRSSSWNLDLDTVTLKFERPEPGEKGLSYLRN